MSTGGRTGRNLYDAKRAETRMARLGETGRKAVRPFHTREVTGSIPVTPTFWTLRKPAAWCGSSAISASADASGTGAPSLQTSRVPHAAPASAVSDAARPPRCDGESAVGGGSALRGEKLAGWNAGRQEPSTRWYASTDVRWPPPAGPWTMNRRWPSSLPSTFGQA